MLKKNLIILSIFYLLIMSGCNSNKSINKIDKPVHCVSCALQKGEIETVGGIISSSKYFQARQDYAVPIPGFIIISSSRHIQSFDNFTSEERIDFIEFLYAVRKKMRELLNIQIIYVIQEEDSNHFHVWLFPRYHWMNQFGKKIRSINTIMEWAQENLKTEDNLAQVHDSAQKLKLILGN